MENKIITALRFASCKLDQSEARFKDLVYKEKLTSEESAELAYLNNLRTRLTRSCGANSLFEISDAASNIVKNYNGMKKRGKLHFTVKLVIHEAFENS